MVIFLLLAYLYVAIGVASILVVIRETHPENSMKTPDIILLSVSWPLTMGIMIAATIEHVVRDRQDELP